MITNFFDALFHFMGSRQSVVTIFLITIGTVIYGMIFHPIHGNGYWEQANLFYSVLAIFESEIILMMQKQIEDLNHQKSGEMHELLKYLAANAKSSSES